MKSKKAKLLVKIIGIFLAMSMVILMVANTVIANKVISSMADVRVEKNSATLEKFNLIGEQINVLSADGIKINAYVVPNEHSKGNVLILHGMHGMDATSVFDYAKFFYDAGYSPVSIDMRAHGKSEGESLSFGYNEVHDVIAVIEYLKKDNRFKGKPIILFGLSMGGSTAINTASKSKHVDGIIAVSPFLSIKSQAVDYMKRDGAPLAFIKIFEPFIDLVLWRKYDVNPIKESPEYAVKNIGDIPVFIIHGDKDTQTDVYQAKKLFDNSGSDKSEIWIVEGRDHLIVEDVLDNSSKEYRDRIIRFLSDNFGE
jgi:uncharacterized protein